MKYKVGDRVRVREDLKVGCYYGDESFRPDMKKYLGKTVTISRVSSREGSYWLKEDDGNWCWTDKMFEAKCKSYIWLKKGVRYYIPRIETKALSDCFIYNNDEVDKRYISRGLVFKTEEEAIECAKKMLEVVK